MIILPIGLFIKIVDKIVIFPNLDFGDSKMESRKQIRGIVSRAVL